MTHKELKALQKEVKQLRDAQTTNWTVHFMIAELERTANGLIVSAEPEKRMQMLKFIKKRLKDCEKALRVGGRQWLPTAPGGGRGPDCPRGYHEEQGICVPDDIDGENA